MLPFSKILHAGNGLKSQMCDNTGKMTVTTHRCGMTQEQGHSQEEAFDWVQSELEVQLSVSEVVV